ncbi:MULTISPECIES: nucleoside permease [unclassified Gilliamella]|uniref:nucleoside permease n=1 Tax=unclassified Gilliamella TaxID=2685620 RepID=UPI001C69A115|nr:MULTISPECIES: nucleoside permease [unclassified Gilliamella]MCX8600953.1 MFS transporter [Gilliamella sp. B3722]MCX8607518.1 MFS transporter [Gilliamella sp. B3771]MCX8610175.1 MFS transporter [Gilliamella sp. B3891]MCX8612565.1 MFS transporter [Gilliamella sp. B3773]MCX8616711.1 MFS transporter [Gilliamella sp. B3770]
MNIKDRLKIMLFFQYFIWGSWLVTFGSYLFKTLHFSGTEVGMIFSTKGLAALIMPCIIGIIADKFVQAKYLYMLCHSICAIALFYAASVDNSTVLFWVMLCNALAFMPTIALSNSISYHCLDNSKLDTVTVFPKIRVYGTIGFIIAMWMISLLKFELSNAQLYVACAASVILVLYSATLPDIAIKKDPKQSWAARLGFDAFVLFKKPTMAVFFLFAMLLGAILQITNTYGGAFLHDFDRIPEFKDSLIVQYPAILLSVSQMAEVAFILTIPFFLKKFGIKKVIMISIIAWTLRFGLFAFGDPTPFGFVLLMLSMIVYGCAFDFFNISGSIFIEKEVSSNIRASAQGLYMTMVNGIGAYLGSILSGIVIDMYTHDGVKDWQSIWLIFASYALILGIIFYFTFNYDHKKTETAL